MAFVNRSLEPATLFSLTPVIPVIVINSLAEARPLAEAILAGGVNVLEVTLRTPIALEAIHLLRQQLPEVFVGAGTVTNSHQLQQCVDAGAEFALSPGLTRELLEAGKAASIPFIPGVSSISELMEGVGLGYNHFKLFPAEVVGGVNLLKAIYGPFKDAHFCPTGGINARNFVDYLSLPNVNCVGGSWIVAEPLIKEGNWLEITSRCLSAVNEAIEAGVFAH
ncbi:MAG: bifunctional 4-hydroxy-2-oxoglutarate aldolase/2-dehydro-3-deoxy-phosphogluconate aldolase [Legionella sp.]|nr:bifunctional 4-hydroxy-2-oxoglutarate aldolase/2-dehydro-3-deoxy-phosphogluconate aldolase [Legionella sp.]